MKQLITLKRKNGIKAKITIHRRDGLVLMKYYNFDNISNDNFKIEHYKFYFEMKRRFYMDSIFTCTINLKNFNCKPIPNFVYNLDLSHIYNRNYTQEQLYRNIRKKIDMPNNFRVHVSQKYAEDAKHFLLSETSIKNLFDCVKDSKKCIALVFGE